MKTSRVMYKTFDGVKTSVSSSEDTKNYDILLILYHDMKSSYTKFSI